MVHKMVKDKLAKLIDVKSIVTITMTVALITLLFTDVSPSKDLLALFCTSYGAVITYFFTHK